MLVICFKYLKKLRKRKRSFSTEKQSALFLECTRSFGQKSNNLARGKNKTVLQNIKIFTDFFFYPFALCDLKDEKKVLIQTKTCLWFSPSWTEFLTVATGKLQSPASGLCLPGVHTLNNLNNTVIYLLTLKQTHITCRG